MNKLLKHTVLLTLAALSFIDISFAQSASTIADIATSLVPQLKSVEPLLGGLSYICGIAFGIRGALKLKEHTETKGQVKLVVPIVLITAAAMFLALPQLVNIGIGTFGFNSGGQTTFTY